MPLKEEERSHATLTPIMRSCLPDVHLLCATREGTLQRLQPLRPRTRERFWRWVWPQVSLCPSQLTHLGKSRLNFYGSWPLLTEGPSHDVVVGS